VTIEIIKVEHATNKKGKTDFHREVFVNRSTNHTPIKTRIQSAIKASVNALRKKSKKLSATPNMMEITIRYIQSVFVKKVIYILISF
jgi:hypothetical protein